MAGYSEICNYFSETDNFATTVDKLYVLLGEKIFKDIPEKTMFCAKFNDYLFSTTRKTNFFLNNWKGNENICVSFDDTDPYIIDAVSDVKKVKKIQEIVSNYLNKKLDPITERKSFVVVDKMSGQTLSYIADSGGIKAFIAEYGFGDASYTNHTFSSEWRELKYQEELTPSTQALKNDVPSDDEGEEEEKN